MGDWQPIETAPDSGSDDDVIVWNSRFPEIKPRVTKPDGEWWRLNKEELRAVPTHWMPLPAPPAIDAAQPGRE